MTNIKFNIAALGAVFAAALLSTSASAQTPHPAPMVYVETNDAKDNQILVFNQGDSGQLTEVASVSTGGKGNGGSLGQGALALAGNGHVLFAVNAGSDDISVFRVSSAGLTLLQRVKSGGGTPLSITENDGLVYVLNAGGATNHINGFVWTREAGLVKIPGAYGALSAASVTPVQIGFNPDGTQVFVTEKATNMIDVFNLTWDGRPMDAVINPSAAVTPFGFAFDTFGDLLVSDAVGGMANASAGSSYFVDSDGNLHARTAVALNHQSSSCWATVDAEGRYLYLADAGSNVISGYRISHTGNIALLEKSGMTASTDPHPIDMVSSTNDQFLYVLSNMGGAIDEYEIQLDGTLTAIGKVVGLPTSISGIAAQ